MRRNAKTTQNPILIEIALLTNLRGLSTPGEIDATRNGYEMTRGKKRNDINAAPGLSQNPTI